MAPSFDSVYSAALSLGFSLCGNEWVRFKSRPTCSYRDGDRSWGLFLKTPKLKIKCLNKSRILEDCYVSIIHRETIDHFFVSLYTGHAFHPHVYSDGLLCIGDNDYLFDRYIREDVALALSLCLSAFSRIDHSGVVSYTDELSYVCQGCRRLRRSSYRTYRPTKNPNGVGYLCPSCLRRENESE